MVTLCPGRGSRKGQAIAQSRETIVLSMKTLFGKEHIAETEVKCSFCNEIWQVKERGYFSFGLELLTGLR